MVGWHFDIDPAGVVWPVVMSVVIVAVVVGVCRIWQRWATRPDQGG